MNTSTKMQRYRGTRRSDREGLNALLAVARKSPPPFDYVLFDDTSRLSRKLSDVLKLQETLKAYGIDVHFVAQHLDSRDPNFNIMFQVYGLVDQDYVTRLTGKVKSSQRDQVLKGFHVGSIPYGYRGVILDSDDPDAIGRAATKGTMLEIVEDEAVNVRRIFDLYAGGNSMMRIARTLNLEGVPWPHASHGQWGEHAIKRIVHNEKYIGINVWNVSYQVKDPETEKVYKRFRPADEHLRVPAPHLRIVSDKQWERVQARLKTLEDKRTARMAGGWGRAKDRQYPLSGLLFCGICGSRMRVGGVQGVGRYECPNHRRRGGCTNKLRIREDRALAQIAEALSKQLLVPDTMYYLIAAVSSELQDALERIRQAESGGGVQDLERAHRDCVKRINNLLESIEVHGGSDAIGARLTTLESVKKRYEEQLRTHRVARDIKFTNEDLRRMVETNAGELRQVLDSDATVARELLQRHLKRLELHPIEVNGLPAFEVIGELDLFEAPSKDESGVLQELSGTLTSQQHTVDRYLRFVIRLHPSVDNDCPLLEPLCQLLECTPELALAPKSASEWARLLQPFMPKADDSEPIGYGTVARCMRIHGELLGRRLAITKTINPKCPTAFLYQIGLRSSDQVSGSEAQELVAA